MFFIKSILALLIIDSTRCRLVEKHNVSNCYFPEDRLMSEKARMKLFFWCLMMFIVSLSLTESVRLFSIYARKGFDETETYTDYASWTD